MEIAGRRPASLTAIPTGTLIEALEVAKMWKFRLRLPHITVGQVNIRWIPGSQAVQKMNKQIARLKGDLSHFAMKTILATPMLHS